MKVIKRDGRLQNFELRKILLSIEKASDEINRPMTQSDIVNISKSIEMKIHKNYKDEVPVGSIQDIVVSQLREDGFGSAAQHYEDYKKDLYEK